MRLLAGTAGLSVVGLSAAAAVAASALSAAAAVAASVAVIRVTAAGHLHPVDRVPAAPIALVLGAQVYPSGRPSAFLQARLDLAHRLFRLGLADVLLLSGDAYAKEGNEPAVMRDYLLRAGLPADKVRCDNAGLDTYDSCIRARDLYGVSRMLVVTQSYHLPRAVATARLLGIDADGVGDDTVRTGHNWRKGWVRDQVACVKTLLDVVSGRPPRRTALD
jgi:vancomycin permeability regulator SanA